MIIKVITINGVTTRHEIFEGLGDRVHNFFKPIAKISDKHLGTDLQNCGGCKQRQDALNKAFPKR